MTNFNNIEELIAIANEKKLPIHEIVIAKEVHDSLRSRENIIALMRTNWQVMCTSIERGIISDEKSVSGLSGGDAKKLYKFCNNPRSYMGEKVLKASSYAVAISEVNALMGRIVACPTAGSCGIVPAALYSARLEHKVSDENIVKALFTAAGIGMVIDQNASIAGAEGGCQAECGTAAGMAAGALVELAGGTPTDVGNAAALAIKNLLGLACDPVAGLVEVPCVKRNGFATVVAMLAADMTLAGIKSVIPADEVIDAMRRIGKALPKSLRETSEGGLATTAAAKEIEKRIYPK